MPTAPATSDTGKREPSLFSVLKFWKRKPDEVSESDIVIEQPETPHQRSHDSIDFFWGYAEEDEDLGEPFSGEEYRSAINSDQIPTYTDNDRRQASDFEKKFLDFSEWEKRRPIPPRSGLLAPPHLTSDEKKAVEVLELAQTFFANGSKVKLKPALQKKVKESRAGYRPVTFSEDGKMKLVVVRVSP